MNNSEIYIIFKSGTKGNYYPVGKVTVVRKEVLKVDWNR
jgi:hypothetical protein